jgi:glycosyltransferase involved in cell wall biosynthesis
MIEEIPSATVAKEVWRVMDRLRPEVVVIGGWSTVESITMLRWASRNRRPVVVMSESTVHDKSRVFWIERIKGFILKFCSSALVGGAPHCRYVNGLGMNSDRIFFGYDAVDNDYFSDKAEMARTHGERWRKHFGLPKRYFLACCRFIPLKNLDRLIEAYSAYRSLAGSHAWDLVLVGDGPERTAVETKVRLLKLDDSVHFEGFRQYDELPFYYGLADAFVHLSTVEPWGLVINEALASRLPVIVSNRCGAAEDLVIDGVSGLVVDPFDIANITKALYKMSSSTLNREAMGETGLQILAHWGPRRFSDGLSRAVATARSRPVRYANCVERLGLFLIGLLLEIRVADRRKPAPRRVTTKHSFASKD